MHSFCISHPPLDGGPIGDGGVPEDGDDSGADVHAVFFVHEILDTRGVGDDAVLADARVLVDDRVGDGGSGADAHRHTACSDHLGLLLVALVVIRADDHGVLDCAPLADLAPETDDGVLHGAVAQRAPVRNNRILDVAFLDLGGGEEPGGGVNGRTRVVELELRGVLGQVEVGFEEALDRSDVLPVVVEKVRLGFWK